MWSSIRREFSVNRDSLWQSGLILAGACLLGEGIAAVMMGIFSREPFFIPLGTMMAVGAAVVSGVIFPAYYFSCGYEQALAMGCTRGRFLAGSLALSLVHIVLMLAAASLAILADMGFYRAFYPQIYAAIDWTDFPSGGVLAGGLALAAAVLLCFGLFLGAALQRWGKRAFWVLWGICMAASFLSGPMVHLAKDGEASLLGRIAGSVGHALAFLPGMVYLCFAGAVLLAAGVFGAVLLLRGSIRHAV